MLRLRTLGGLSIGNGASTGSGTANRRPHALLALLAIEGRQGLSRDKIVALLWPESDSEHGRNSLSHAISLLRRQLGADDLVVGTAELRVNPEVLSCDATEFEERIAANELEAAIGLYRGPFLDGVFLRNAPEFERWVDQVRSRLERAQGDALERLATRATMDGDHVSAVRWWRQRASLTPGNSRVALELMKSLVASGDAAGAVVVDREHRALLRDELGIEPDAAFTTFAAAVRAGPGRPGEALQPAAPASAASTEGAAGTDAPVTRDGASPDAPATNRRVGAATTHRTRWLVAAAVVVALFAVVLPQRTSGRDDDTARIDRLAVLPLVNRTGDPALNAVAAALTEELISSLLREGVRVMGYYTVAKYEGTSRPLDQIGRELEVDAVATWMLRRQGSRLQVSLEVARPQSGEGLWAFSRYAVDSLQLPEVAAAAARELSTRLSARGAAPPRTPRVMASTSSPEAMTAYLLGMQDYHGGPPKFESGLGHFQRAIDADSSFAPAWAALGYTYTLGIDYAVLPLDDACDKARRAIQRALALDSALALAHLARARVLQHCDWNWKEAEGAYRLAIALEPSAMAYLTYGWLLEWYLGRAHEGVAMGDTAVAIDPRSALMHEALAWRLRGAGDLARAEAEVRVALALDPERFDGHWILAEVYLRRGDYVSAEREALRVRARGGHPANWTTLGEIYARTGRASEARAYMRLLSQEEPLAGPARVALARTQMALGERDAALATLEQAVRDRVFIIPHQPYWDPIRDEPRFQALMRRMGL